VHVDLFREKKKNNEFYTNCLQRYVYNIQADGNSLFNSQIKQTGTQADKNSKKNVSLRKKKILPKVKMKR
jgi:hypothetical protein